MSTFGHKDKVSARPTFEYNSQPVRAAGILITTIEENKSYYLLRSTRKGTWSDIGGKTDKVDRDIISTIVRETVEETNHKLLSPHHSYKQAYEMLDNLLRNEEIEIFYCPRAKYILIKVVFDTNVKHLSMKRFGLRESTDKMDHYYAWISNVQRQKLHPRLKCHSQYDKIFKVYN